MQSAETGCGIGHDEIEIEGFKLSEAFSPEFQLHLKVPIIPMRESAAGFLVEDSDRTAILLQDVD
ncbi:hypothetical protein D3C83_284560 [compost metagenome]